MAFAWDEQVVRTILALACLLVATLAVMRVGRIGMSGDLVVSAARAIVQLSLVAVVIAWLFANPQWAVVYVAIMLAAATATAIRRIGCGYRQSGAPSRYRLQDVPEFRAKHQRRKNPQN